MVHGLINFAVGFVTSYFFNKALEGTLQTKTFPVIKLFDVPGTWGYGLDDVVATVSGTFVASQITHGDYLMSGLGALTALILDKHLIEPISTGLIKFSKSGLATKEEYPMSWLD
jgi:hypothetical protein